MSEESVRKIAIIIIVIALGGKILAGLITRLIESPTNRIAQNLSIEKFLNNQLKMGETNKREKAEKQKTKKIPTSLFVSSQKIPFSVAAVTKNEEISKIQIAKADTEKKKEETKKEKERRKKRKKKLEELTDKKKEVKSIPQFKVSFKPITKDSVITSPGGSINNIPKVETTTPLPMTPQSITPTTVPRKTVNIEALTDALVNRPSPSTYKTFMDYFQAKMISPSQFYKILAQMQKSKFLDSRKYAVMAAETINRPESFHVLVQAIHSENEDPNVRQEAQKGLESYARIEDLPILHTELKSGDADSQLAAATLMNLIMSQYETNKQPHTSQDASQLFIPFKELFEAMAHDPTKPQLQNVAENNLTLINRILTTAPAASSGPAVTT